MRDATEQLGHDLTQVLGRLEAAVQQPSRRCCDVCGCLMRRGEPSCPNCALSAAGRAAS